LEELSELLQEGDLLIGDYSNAKAEVDIVDLSPVKIVEIITRPDPYTAQPDDDYGYSETITEYYEGNNDVPVTVIVNRVDSVTTFTDSTTITVDIA
jgi:hypothetical protein